MKKLMITAFLLATTNVFANPVSDTVNSITNWTSNEKANTIAYQKKSWTDAKKQLADLFKKFGLNKKD